MELNVSVFRTSNAAIRHLPEFQINVLLSVEKSVSPFNYIIHNKIKQRSKKKNLITVILNHLIIGVAISSF